MDTQQGRERERKDFHQRESVYVACGRVEKSVSVIMLKLIKG